MQGGNFGWSWTTDLGAEFYCLLQLYNLTSPFSWPTIPFPQRLGAFFDGPAADFEKCLRGVDPLFYLARFVRRRGVCSAGFAFCTPFPDSCSITRSLTISRGGGVFPLLLIGMEELVQNNRRGFFCGGGCIKRSGQLLVFIGSAVFCILYFAFRCTDKSWGGKFQKILRVAFEALLGMGLSPVHFPAGGTGILRKSPHHIGQSAVRLEFLAVLA